LAKSIFADQTTNTTVYDAAGRVELTIDARGTTNAFGYDEVGRRTVSGVPPTFYTKLWK
jgi:YD repeat-containing protein